MAPEKRLIDANEFVEWMRNNYCEHCDSCGGLLCGACVYDTFITHIEASATVDAVEVVRCKNCKHFKPGDDGIYYCKRDKLNPGKFMKNYDFCSYGERRDT